MQKLIKNWNELCGLENENFRLEIDTDMGCGYIISKATNQRVAYLSTHTFYGMKYKASTHLFQSFGFDIEIDNWDKES